MDLISNGRSALLAFQRALVTTSNNIANVYTEGYTRQEVSFTARMGDNSSKLNAGSGVEVLGIERQYNEYLTNNLIENKSRYHQDELTSSMMDQLDQMLVNSDTGIGRFSQDFFNAVDDVSNDPTSIAARETMLGTARTLASRYQSVGASLEKLESDTNGYLGDAVQTANDLVREIAAVNKNIQNVSSSAEDAPNALLDQRDLLVKKLSEFLAVKTVDNGNGTNNVYISGGHNLVIGSSYNTLAIKTSEFGGTTREIGVLTGSDSFVNVTEQISGGRIGAVVNFKSDVLQRAKDDVNLMAAGLSTQFNNLHTTGFDLDSAAGATFFGTAAPTVAYDSAENSADATIAYQTPLNNTVISNWRGATYRVDFDATADLWRIQNQRDETSVTVAGGGGAATTLNFDGLVMTTTGVANDGDSFLVTPFAENAKNMTVNVTDARKIAAASRADEVGNGEIAAQLADISQNKLMNGSTQSVDMIYESMVSFVGAKASTAQVSFDASKVLFDRAQAQRDDLSGVNLDEEAANLLKYQQAYQAAAKVMAASDQMFQTLITSLRFG